MTEKRTAYPFDARLERVEIISDDGETLRVCYEDKPIAADDRRESPEEADAMALADSWSGRFIKITAAAFGAACLLVTLVWFLK